MIDAIALAAGKPITSNMRSVVGGLERMGDALGLDRPHRLAHFLPQVMHESMGFTYDRELWGPTAAQLRYECDPSRPWTAKDPRNKLAFALGNDQPGDGRRFAGRAGIQITGRYNYAAFRDWCRARIDPAAPDFEADPEAINTDPWEGLAPLWYWDWRGLGALADANQLEAITRRINGGTNGLADRRRYYARTALVLLGRRPTDVRGFQTAAGLTPDGISGQITEASLHKALLALPARSWGGGPPSAAPATIETRVAVLEASVAKILERIDP